MFQSCIWAVWVSEIGSRRTWKSHDSQKRNFAWLTIVINTRIKPIFEVFSSRSGLVFVKALVWLYLKYCIPDPQKWKWFQPPAWPWLYLFALIGQQWKTSHNRICILNLKLADSSSPWDWLIKVHLYKWHKYPCKCNVLLWADYFMR